MYCDEIISCIKEGREYDEEAFFKVLTEFEDNWVMDDTAPAVRQSTDYMTLSQSLLDKYF
jgi:hypothetical protein